MYIEKQVSKELESVVSKAAIDMRGRADKYAMQSQYADHIYKEGIWGDMSGPSIKTALNSYLNLSFVHRISKAHKVQEYLDNIGSLMALLGYTQKEANQLLDPIRELEPKFKITIPKGVIAYHKTKCYKPRIEKSSETSYKKDLKKRRQKKLFERYGFQK